MFEKKTENQRPRHGGGELSGNLAAYLHVSGGMRNVKSWKGKETSTCS